MAEQTPSSAGPGAPDPGAAEGRSTASFEAGARLGDLVLVRELGRGGQAVVFEALQETLDRRVAVKILSRDYVHSDEQAARFRREAEATGRLGHPNIVAVYEYREVEGHPLIVEELVEGRSLADELEERWMGRERIDNVFCDWVAHVVRQLAHALDHAHERGIVHRDMKPDNVLLAPDGTPKIADFGLAKVEDKAGLSMSGTILGTPYYMSPEQVDGGATNPIDGRSDVYSLGAVLYRMLTDRVPVKSRNLEGIFLDILHRTPTPPRNIQPIIHRDLEAVCLKALEKQPRNRYQSAAELAEDLERYIARQPTLARPVSGVVKVVRSLSRLATSTLGVLCLLIPALWFLLDVFVMSPMGTTSDGVVGTRLGIIAAAAALLAWPLSLLGVRWTGGRAWAVATSVLLALALGGGAAWRVLDERLHRLHVEAREVLELNVTLADRRDVQDVQEYIDAWGDRFEDDDLFLVARAYLERGRAGRAEEWVRRGERETTAPVYKALLEAVADATGSGDGDVASIFDEASADTAWTEWQRIGDVFRLMGHLGDARRAYEKAGYSQGADRDLVNLSLARVLTDMCRWEAAGERLRDVLVWRPDDPEANFVARRIAFSKEDWSAAEQHVKVFDSNPKTPLLAKLQRRYELLEKRNFIEDAAAFLQASLDAHGDLPQVVEWAARERFRTTQLLLPVLMRQLSEGAMDAYAETLDRMREGFLEAEGLYERLRAMDEDWATASIGLSAVNLELRQYLPEEAEERFDRAVRFAEEAIAKDPGFWEPHYNLALAEWWRAATEAGGFDAVSTDAMQAFVDRMRTALSHNSLQPQPMNDTAVVLGMLAERTGDTLLLGEALTLARRAVRIQAPDAETECRPEGAERQLHSALEDTLGQLYEQAGRLDEALAAAKRSVAVLASADADLPKREANVERLEALLEED